MGQKSSKDTRSPYRPPRRPETRNSKDDERQGNILASAAPKPMTEASGGGNQQASFLSKRDHKIIMNLKKIVAKDNVNCELIERKIIDENSQHTYETLFAPFMDDKLTGIRIEDPHLNKYHQFHNLVRFLEVCVLNAQSLRVVHLVMKKGDKPEEQQSCLNDIASSLRSRNITLFYELNPGIHDRCIA